MNPFSLFGDLLLSVWHVLTGLVGFLQRPIQYSLEHLTTFFDGNPAGRAIGGFGLAVLVVTATIRLILSPLFAWQMRTQVKIQEDAAKMRPHLAKLRKEYGKDRRQEMAAAQQAMYKEHGLHPLSSLAGCLPMLAQLPVIYGLFYGIRAAVKNLQAGQLGFLWIRDVSKTGLEACCKTGKTTDLGQLFSSHWTVLLFPLMAALLTVVQSKMMMPPVNPNPTEQDRMQQQMGQVTTYIIPVVILFSGMNFPQGLAIYWVTQSSLMIAQQYHLLGWGQLAVPSWVPGAHRQTPLSLRKLAATTGKKVETLERDIAKSRRPSPASSSLSTPAPGGNGTVRSAGGNTGASDGRDADGRERPSGRAKSRSSRPQNRKRRR